MSTPRLPGGASSPIATGSVTTATVSAPAAFAISTALRGSSMTPKKFGYWMMTAAAPFAASASCASSTVPSAWYPTSTIDRPRFCA